MLLADGLSRLLNKKNKVIDLDVKVDFVQFLTEKLTQICQATNADPILCELRVRILQNKIPQTYPTGHIEMSSLWRMAFCLKETGYWSPNQCRPKHWKNSLWSQGSDKYKLRAKTCVFWSGINSDIDKIVQRCTICQELQKSQSAESLIPHEIPVWPWQIVATDIFNLNRHNYLLIVDYYEKYPFIRKLREFSSKEVKQTFAKQRVLERLISNNGPHFSSQQLKNLLKDGILSTSPLLRNTPNQMAWQNGACRPSR